MISRHVRAAGRRREAFAAQGVEPGESVALALGSTHPSAARPY